MSVLLVSHPLILRDAFKLFTPKHRTDHVPPGQVYKLPVMPTVNRWQLKLLIIAHMLFKNLSLQAHCPFMCHALCFPHPMNYHTEAQCHRWRVGTIIFCCFAEMKDQEMKRSGRGSLCYTKFGVRPRVCAFHNALLFFTSPNCTCITEHVRFCLESTAVTPHRQPCTTVTPESLCSVWFLSPSFSSRWPCLNLPVPSGFWLLPDKTRASGMLVRVQRDDRS